MRHRKARTKLGRTGSHRRAMYSNMLKSLVEYGRIETTERKAKELRGIAERVVTRATSLGDLLEKDWSELELEDRARVVHAMRMARRTLRDRDAVLQLFQEVAPRFLGRPGGYTRVIKKGFRKGDGAPMALIEFIDAREVQKAAAGGEEEKKGGLLDRFRRKKED